MSPCTHLKEFVLTCRCFLYQPYLSSVWLCDVCAPCDDDWTPCVCACALCHGACALCDAYDAEHHVVKDHECSNRPWIKGTFICIMKKNVHSVCTYIVYHTSSSFINIEHRLHVYKMSWKYFTRWCTCTLYPIPQAYINNSYFNTHNTFKMKSLTHKVLRNSSHFQYGWLCCR